MSEPEKKPAPRRICAWCKLDMGPAEEGHTGDTHGICPSCLPGMLAEAAEASKGNLARED